MCLPTTMKSLSSKFIVFIILTTITVTQSMAMLSIFMPNATLIFYITPTDYKEVTFENAPTVIGTKYFNVNYDTKIFVHGFDGQTSGDCVQTMIKTFTSKCINFAILNWEDAASAGSIPYLFYPRAVLNSQKIGKSFASALVEMSKSGMNLSKVHMIGLSLGAQMCGIVGRELKSIANTTLTRISGLEPAGPGYETFQIEQTLHSSDAQYVDCLHTDPGGYGVKSAYCDLDIYANCQNFENVASGSNHSTGYTNKQPGCPPRDMYSIMSMKNFCSHRRACFLYAESQKYPHSAPCAMSPSCPAWIASHGAPAQINYVGPNVDTTIKGQCYLSTNNASLYGKGDVGLKP